MSNFESALIGIQAASKILNITPPEVYFASGSDFPNPEISSIYRHKDNEIIFNEDWINRSNELEILVTAFHETRHAYQNHCIKTKSREDIETINVWEKEFHQYTIPSGKNTPKSDIDYLKQSIEIDAIAFAYHQMKELFDVEVKIPKLIKIQVFDRTDSFSKITTFDN
ncbi:MAG: hypothetical protein CVV57_01590 [Tenericutes bacterium HGW-Tenericutes-2]|jgi:hypothetical protein|nr:MAG: hypothetical protein CVV57_01590 [Tenericutes bacterium HGW-Tenericutes-2]